MKRIVRLTESDLTRIVRRVIKESEMNPMSQILELKNYIDRLLSYYEVKDGKYFDKKTGDQVSTEPMIETGQNIKTKLESILVGSKEDNKDVTSVENIKNEIINGKFKEFFGDYENVKISKNMIIDWYTDIRCEYFRKGFDRTGKKLNRSLEARPWCVK
jgi:transcription antitermination factor NusG